MTLLGSLIATLCIYFKGDRFVSLIGPLVFGFYTLTSFFIIFMTDSVVLVLQILNAGALLYVVYAILLSDKFLMQCIIRLILAIFFSANIMYRRN